MSLKSLAIFALLPLALIACSDNNDGSSAADMAPAPDLICERPDTGTHAMHVRIGLTEDAMGVPFRTQNGSTVYIQKADIAGKPLIWATIPGGESIFNTLPTEVGNGKMA